ncbi:MAG: hypothetical protein LUI09_01745 [Prevotellaceae bacterium]|nr:hypothetical protein [Prevotellaceae bacterium]
MTQMTITYQGREVTAGELEAMIGKAGFDNAMGCYERHIEGRRLTDGETDAYEYLTPSDELITFETEMVDDWE